MSNHRAKDPHKARRVKKRAEAFLGKRPCSRCHKRDRAPGQRWCRTCRGLEETNRKRRERGLLRQIYKRQGKMQTSLERLAGQVQAVRDHQLPERQLPESLSARLSRVAGG